jgi:hypothetical protein
VAQKSEEEKKTDAWREKLRNKDSILKYTWHKIEKAKKGSQRYRHYWNRLLECGLLLL